MARTPAKRELAAPMIFRYLQDREFYRVRRSDWPNDMFELLTEQQFGDLRSAVARFGIPILEEHDA